MTPPRAPARRGERGGVLILAMLLVLLLAVVGAAVIRHAARDRIAAAQLASKERAFACAETGLQYGRRFFGLRYEATRGWNDYLAGTVKGYVHDPASEPPDLTTLPKQVLGASDGSAYDPGTTVDGSPQFWVSIRDDDDELPSGLPKDDPARDNNELVILRSQCIAFFYLEGGQERTAAVEATLGHIQSASDYGNVHNQTNSPDVLGTLGNR